MEIPKDRHANSPCLARPPLHRDDDHNSSYGNSGLKKEGAETRVQTPSHLINGSLIEQLYCSFTILKRSPFHSGGVPYQTWINVKLLAKRLPIYSRIADVTTSPEKNSRRDLAFGELTLSTILKQSSTKAKASTVWGAVGDYY
jgi:hypothetical protein